VWSDTYRDVDGWLDEAIQWGSLRFPDIDGDGSADVCGLSNTQLVCRLSNATDGFVTSVTSEGWAEADGWSADGWWGTLGFPDLDGDGDADVCGRTDAGIQCARFEAGAFTVPASWTAMFDDAGGWNVASQWGTIQYVDFDGDGLDDVCGRDSMGVMCGRSNGADAFADATLVLPAFSDSNGWDVNPSYWRTIQFGTAGTPPTCGAQADPSGSAPWRTSALPPRSGT